MGSRQAWRCADLSEPRSRRDLRVGLPDAGRSTVDVLADDGVPAAVAAPAPSASLRQTSPDSCAARARRNSGSSGAWRSIRSVTTGRAGSRRRAARRRATSESGESSIHAIQPAENAA